MVKCVNFIKSLYGLREAPLCWYEKLNEYLLEITFKRSGVDPYLYVNKEI